MSYPCKYERACKFYNKNKPRCVDGSKSLCKVWQKFTAYELYAATYQEIKPLLKVITR